LLHLLQLVEIPHVSLRKRNRAPPAFRERAGREGEAELLLGGRRGLLARRGLLRRVARPLELLLEPLDAAGRVDELLLARVEGVASRADLDVDLGLRRTRQERVPATAVDLAGLVVGMDVRLHDSLAPGEEGEESHEVAAVSRVRWYFLYM